VQKPGVIINYNKDTCGVYVADQHASLYWDVCSHSCEYKDESLLEYSGM
jgi:hypothetical protein